MTTTPDPTPTQETPMTDPTRPDTGWPHEQLKPGTPADAVHGSLLAHHPRPLTALQLADDLAVALDEVASALAELEDAGIVTPSTREPDAVWMLHGPARRAADEAQPHA